MMRRKLAVALVLAATTGGCFWVTTKSEGMGLGLPISRTIVEAHGGTIRAEYRPGGGAAFTFTLPKARRRRV